MMMVMMMMMMMMVMIIIPVIIMIMIKITIAIMITIMIMNSQDSERRCLISNLISWRVSPSDPWSFIMTCSLGIYVGMQTARARSNNNDSEY